LCFRNCQNASGFVKRQASSIDASSAVIAAGTIGNSREFNLDIIANHIGRFFVITNISSAFEIINYN
jgi:hypothetical protein